MDDKRLQAMNDVIGWMDAADDWDFSLWQSEDETTGAKQFDCTAGNHVGVGSTPWEAIENLAAVCRGDEVEQPGNYVADCETHPQSVTFANGRRVRIVIEDGQPSLDVDWDYQPTPETDAALELMEPDFIARLTPTPPSGAKR